MAERLVMRDYVDGCGRHLLRPGGGRGPGGLRRQLGSAWPKNTRFNGAGMDISPALYGCLGHSGAVAGASDRVNWRFVDADAVPAGPWTRIIT